MPMNADAELAELKELYERLKPLCQSDTPIVRDASVLMFSLAHDALRHIDAENPPAHPTGVH